MSRIELKTIIAAAPERCFDLSLSVELHLRSTESTDERVVEGPTEGTLKLGDVITWEARHFWRRRRLTVTVSEHDRPRHFRDEQVRGPFKRLVHDHYFLPDPRGTLMRDVFDVSVGFRPFDALVLTPYMRRFLVRRNRVIRAAAEESDA